MSLRVTFVCDACGVTGEGIPGEYEHPDPPIGWVWFWGASLRIAGPHACSIACWQSVNRSPEGKLYLPDSHERREDRRPARTKADAEEIAAAQQSRVVAERAPPPRSFVYFIQRGLDGPVKIGFSKNPGARLAALQTSIPERIHLLGILDGGKPEEQRLHRRFDSSRINGEWFHPVPELLAYVRDHGR